MKAPHVMSRTSKKCQIHCIADHYLTSEVIISCCRVIYIYIYICIYLITRDRLRLSSSAMCTVSNLLCRSLLGHKFASHLPPSFEPYHRNFHCLISKHHPLSTPKALTVRSTLDSIKEFQLAEGCKGYRHYGIVGPLTKCKCARSTSTWGIEIQVVQASRCQTP